MHAESDRKQQSERRPWEAPQVTDIDGTVEGGTSPYAVETKTYSLPAFAAPS